MEKSLYEMMRHDEALLERVKTSVPAPPGITGLRFEEAEDSQGNPAAWIWAVAETEAGVPQSTMREWFQYMDNVKRALIAGGFETWPIMRLDYSEPRKMKRAHGARG